MILINLLTLEKSKIFLINGINTKKDKPVYHDEVAISMVLWSSIKKYFCWKSDGKCKTSVDQSKPI